MCDDHGAGEASAVGEASAAGEPEWSRRDFLNAAAVVAGAGAVLPRTTRHAPPQAERGRTASGLAAYSMAMHVHSSFSEQSGSMDSQLFQAASNSVDVLWWTDHDARMDGIGYRKTVHFTSLTDEKGGPGQRGPWTWTKVESGSLAGGSGGQIVGAPYSPSDPVAGGSLHLTARSNGTARAKFGYYADSHPAGWNYRDNLAGQSLTIDVLLDGGWSRGYLELLIASSYHEAVGGRPAGDYTLSYRFGPAGTPVTRVARGLQGVITIPVQPTSHGNPWCTVTVRPAKDIAALWPDLDYRDFALWGLTLSAVSEGDLVSGYFDYLRFGRRLSGEAFLRQQAAMVKALSGRYPGVAQRQGLEVSWGLPHINWFGGTVTIPDYAKTTLGGYATFLRTTVVPQIHAAGGLVSYNHPYGYGDPAKLPVAEQDALLAKVARALLPGKGRPAALGADLIEVGYHLRQGVDLAHHVALWDIMSRNAVFLTGNGTSDDHFGRDWRGIPNNWITSAWAASTAERDLLAALAAGRAWSSSLPAFRGSLDLMVDGSCPMGSVSVSTALSRRLVASATAIPAGGSLQILQGAVDHAGTQHLAADTAVIRTYSRADLAGGSVRQRIDTAHASFVRSQVLNAAGQVISLSNPVWLLRSAPAGGIPAPRAA
jgi:hypothetical protein